MTVVAVGNRRQVHVAVRSGSAVAVGVGDEPVALAGGEAVEQALAVADLAPRALSLQPRESFGMAYQGRRLFTAIGAVAGRRGQQGIPGPAVGQAFQRIAGEVLSALRAVWEGPSGDVFSLDYRNGAAIYLLLGLTLTAADTGGAVNVQRSGPIDDSAWSWMPGPVWLGVDGALTQVPPAEGFCVLLGSAVSATRLILDIHQPISMG